jgi:archaeal flagellin FlaB
MILEGSNIHPEGVDMRNFNEDAFTGLEAAIVLIAFVVVAAVFSYVVLGAGFFTTQKSQEVVHTGVSQASSTMEIVGDVYGIKTTGSEINRINFTVGLAAGGTEVDMDKVVMTWSTKNEVIIMDNNTPIDTSDAGSNTWTIISRKNDDGDNLLEKGEQLTLSVGLGSTLGINEQFNLEVKPSVGASIGIKRSAPGGIETVNILY